MDDGKMLKVYRQGNLQPLLLKDWAHCVIELSHWYDSGLKSIEGNGNDIRQIILWLQPLHTLPLLTLGYQIHRDGRSYSIGLVFQTITKCSRKESMSNGLAGGCRTGAK